MKSELFGEITFSGSISNAKEDIAKFIEESNKDLLKRGAPDGLGASVISHNVLDSKLELKIEGKQIRAHEALIRLKKGISTAIGKKYRVGARTVEIKNYSIEIDLEKEPKEAAKIKIPFVESLTFDGKKAKITFSNIGEEYIANNYIDRIISLLKEKVDAQYYEGKAEHWEQLWRSPEKKMAWNKDPTEEMLKRNWLKQGPTKGKWFFRPQITKIFRTMEKIAVEEVLLPLGFQEVIEPHHDAFEILIKTGHLEGLPMELYYVCEPKSRDPADWEYFRDYIKIKKEVPYDELMKLISPPNASICYAQCPVIYWSFQGVTLPDADLPILVFDRAANSNRYESGGRHGIERVDEFHRIEPVYIGTKEQLVSLREKLIDRYKYVFNEILDLEWRMAWVTPFYMAQAGKLGIEENSESRVKGTIDFEAYMPYRGSRENSEWLEFQNLSIVGDKYTKAFNIKAQKSELWSGCSGIGLERWTAAFLAQHGLEPSGWPKEFRERLGERPKGITFL
ncbi:MAG: serine--tRNA ligase [Thermoplasmata archaeon]